MVKIRYDVTDASPWDPTPINRPPADLVSDRQLVKWNHHLLCDGEAMDYLRDHYALTGETITNRLIGLRKRSDGEWFTIPVFEGIGTELTLRTLKERQCPPERVVQPKYRATAGRGIWLYPWPISRGEVVICSGEFDQMTLEQAGFNAVTSTGGVDPRGWRSEWLLRLGSDRRCRIVFDRGEETYAETLAGRLAPYARKVNVIYLPDGLPLKTDVTDLAREWGYASLRRFIVGQRSRRRLS